MKIKHSILDNSAETRAYSLVSQIWKILTVVVIVLILISALGYIIYDRDLSIYPLAIGIALLFLCFVWLFGKIIYLLSTIYNEISVLKKSNTDDEYFLFEEKQDYF